MTLLQVFRGRASGGLPIRSLTTIAGQPLAAASGIEVGEAAHDAPPDPAAVWTLRGVGSNVRYATGSEVKRLRAVQEPLGRAEARRVAIIPIRKSAAWWDLAQDERRSIFEETSHHTAIGLEYLPAVARRLLHSRDLGEPFDFITWFEFRPDDEPAFDELVARLRATREWRYVEREVDIRFDR